MTKAVSVSPQRRPSVPSVINRMKRRRVGTAVIEHLKKYVVLRDGEGGGEGESQEIEFDDGIVKEGMQEGLLLASQFLRDLATGFSGQAGVEHIRSSAEYFQKVCSDDASDEDWSNLATGWQHALGMRLMLELPDFGALATLRSGRCSAPVCRQIAWSVRALIDWEPESAAIDASLKNPPLQPLDSLECLEFLGALCAHAGFADQSLSISD